MYRLSRNIESSLIDYFTEELKKDGWEGISCEKFLVNKNSKPPVITIFSFRTDIRKLEIGSGRFIKFPQIVIRIFAKSEGQREDLADWILEKLEDNIPYYIYEIKDGKVSKKIAKGYINILNIIRNEKELANTDPSVLEEEDRYRHNITVSCIVGETL